MAQLLKNKHSEDSDEDARIEDEEHKWVNK